MPTPADVPRIHVVCDNAAFHKSKAVRAWLEAVNGRVVVHYLPTRAPEENPVDLVFRRLHEAVTRNHRYADLDDLLQAVDRWLKVEGRAEPYRLAA